MVKALCIIAGIVGLVIETMGQSIDLKFGRRNQTDWKIV
jgi:hypothetical protein